MENRTLTISGKKLEKLVKLAQRSEMDLEEFLDYLLEEAIAKRAFSSRKIKKPIEKYPSLPD